MHSLKGSEIEVKLDENDPKEKDWLAEGEKII